MTTAADTVQVSLTVAVDPATAFEVFTGELDLWWRRGPRFRFVAPFEGAMRLEPGVGGRLLHEHRPGASFEVGQVQVWEPPRRLVLTWRLPSFPPEMTTRVDVRFDPAGENTRVTVTHSGWDQVPLGHPARHGLDGQPFVVMKGSYWADLLAALARHASARPGAAPPERTDR
jgi:uncharacterized protein YndB with AHSA1/START domain